MLNSALDILGLSKEANLDELEEQYRSLAAKFHPDKGGSDVEMQRINVAKDIVTAYYQTKTALVPIDSVKEIVLAANKGLAEYQSKKEKTKHAFGRVRDINTSTVKKFKRLATFSGGISAAALFLSKDIPDFFVSIIGVDYIKAFSFIIGINSAVIWWYLDIKVKNIEQDINDLETNLNDNEYYVDLIQQFLGGEAEGSWRKTLLANRIKDWVDEKENRHKPFTRLITNAGSEEIASLIIAKGIENDLLKKETKTEYRRLIEIYTLNI